VLAARPRLELSLRKESQGERLQLLSSKKNNRSSKVWFECPSFFFSLYSQCHSELCFVSATSFIKTSRT
jgi:hypothetical protein